MSRSRQRCSTIRSRRRWTTIRSRQRWTTMGRQRRWMSCLGPRSSRCTMRSMRRYRRSRTSRGCKWQPLRCRRPQIRWSHQPPGSTPTSILGMMGWLLQLRSWMGSMKRKMMGSRPRWRTMAPHRPQSWMPGRQGWKKMEHQTRRRWRRRRMLVRWKRHRTLGQKSRRRLELKNRMLGQRLQKQRPQGREWLRI